MDWHLLFSSVLVDWEGSAKVINIEFLLQVLFILTSKWSSTGLLSYVTREAFFYNWISTGILSYVTRKVFLLISVTFYKKDILVTILVTFFVGSFVDSCLFDGKCFSSKTFVDELYVWCMYTCVSRIIPTCLQ